MSATPRDHPRDELALYAMDALEGADREPVEAHLETCAACRAELDEHRETLAQLAPEEAPPPAVWERIRGATDPGGDLAPAQAPRHLAEAATASAGDRRSAMPRHAEGSPRGSVVSRPWRWGQPARRVVGALAAAAVVVIVVVLAFGVFGTDSEPDLAELAENALSDPDSTVGTLSDPSGNDAARVVVSDDGSFVLLDDLPVLPADEAYQLWALDGPEPVSLGVLGDGGEDTVATVVPPRSTQLAISQEAAGGVSAPSGPVVASGALPSSR
jgi:anti-sigma-K factor RskA